MKVIKVLNNSLVLVLDNAGHEKILMGKGIGYHKTIGDAVLPIEVEKEFLLNDNEFSTNIMRLAVDVDSVYFDITKQLIDIAENDYGMKLLDHLFLALTDHMLFIVKRQREGLVIPNYYNNNVKHFYKNEFEIGKKALILLEEALDIHLDESEANTIALHFVNAQENLGATNNFRLVDTLIRDILGIVQYTARIKYNTNSISYSRFVTHLCYFLNRIFNNEEDTSEALLMFKEMGIGHDIENRCVDAIDKFLNVKIGVGINEQERCYLVIHIHRIILDSN